MKRQNKLWIMQFLLPVILAANMVSVAEAGIATGNGTAATATEKQVVIPDTREAAQNKNADENIKVGINPDKENYDEDENIKVYISIENISKNYLDEIQVEPIVPEGMEVEFTDNEIGEDLKAGVKLYATMKVTADESKQTESTESRKIVKKTTSDSKSEDSGEEDSGIFLAVIAIAFIAVIIILILMHRKKKRNKKQYISYLLIFTLLGAMLPTGFAKAETEPGNELTAYTTFELDGEDVEVGIKVSYKIALEKINTTDNITIKYQVWGDLAVIDSLNEEWSKKYPNIKVEAYEVAAEDYDTTLLNNLGTDDMPDVFWIMGSPDFATVNGMVADMTPMWEADKDAQNIIGGVNEYKLGYLQTDTKWLTPVRFYPSEAWVDMNYFAKKNIEMPSMDWTFEDMQKCVENSTAGDGSGWGISEAVSVVEWYPVAAGRECIGTFGWTGESFDFTYWEKGMQIEKSFRDNGYKAPDVIAGTDNQCPQDMGMTAIRLDNWWCWERYWNTGKIYENQVYYVPYKLPHTQDNKNSEVNLSTMDFAGIYADTEYSREAYEVLKYFGWGAEGWNYKIFKADEITAAASASGKSVTPLDNCPVTLDETVWESYEKKYPTTAAGGDTVGKKNYGIDRSPYFDAYFETVKNGKWTCSSESQVLGIGTFMTEVYNNNNRLDCAGADNVESAVFEKGKNPADFIKDLSEMAMEYHDEFKTGVY